MARGRVIHRGRTSGVRRSTQWIASSIETDFTALAANTQLLDQSFAFLEPSTIIRTRGSIWVRSDQLSATESPFGALGMAVVSNEAAVAGPGSVPMPVADQDSSKFFLWQPWLADVFLADATSFYKAFVEYKFDSKAMRKVNNGDTAVIVVENSSATDGVNFLMQFRMLIKLHG